MMMLLDDAAGYDDAIDDVASDANTEITFWSHHTHAYSICSSYSWSIYTLTPVFYILMDHLSSIACHFMIGLLTSFNRIFALVCVSSSFAI